MRILLFTRNFHYIRHFESTIKLLADRGHSVHIAADRRDVLDGARLVENLASYSSSITFGWTPQQEVGAWQVLASDLRLSLDYLRYFQERYAATPGLRARAEERTPAIVRSLAKLPGLGSAGGRRAVYSVLRAADLALPIGSETTRFIQEHDPDLVVLTPLIDLGSPQIEYFRAAQALGKHTALCVLSWDHLSSKALIRDLPDLITVWNEIQRREALDLHGVPEDRLVVTGAQTYDHWFDWQPSQRREDFCHAVGLDPAQPFIVYTCSALLRASGPEAPFVLSWLKAVRASSDPRLRECGVLIRPHPARIEEWKSIDLSPYGNTVLWPRASANPVVDEAKNEYFDTLFHSAAVVGVNTSAFIEAAVVGKPVYTVLVPELAESQVGTIHFHYLRQAGGGLLHTAENLQAHVAQLSEALDPQTDRAALSVPSQRFVEAFVRPFGRDAQSTLRLVDALEATAHRDALLPARPIRARKLKRAALYPIGVALWAQRQADRQSRLGKPPTGGALGLFAGQLGLVLRRRVLRWRPRWRRWAGVFRRRLRKNPVLWWFMHLAPVHAVDVGLARQIRHFRRGIRRSKLLRFRNPVLRWFMCLAPVRATSVALARQVRHARRRLRRNRLLRSVRNAPSRARKKTLKAARPRVATRSSEMQRAEFVKAAIGRLAQGSGPILVGPWTGSIELELLYWIPFLHWAKAYGELSADRLIVVSRGGAAPWYGHITQQYADVLQWMSTPDFLARRADTHALERDVVQLIQQSLSLDDINVLQPSLMLDLFSPAWQGEAPRSVIESFTAPRVLPLDESAEHAQLRLPAQYVAVQASTTRAFPDTPSNRAFLSGIVDNLLVKTPVVLLEDDWRPGARSLVDDRDGLVRLGGRLAATTRLADQTAVVHGAESFVGTMTGFSLAAPFYGRDALAFFSERPGLDRAHLETARRTFATLGQGTYISVSTHDMDLLRLTLADHPHASAAAPALQLHAVAERPQS